MSKSREEQAAALVAKADEAAAAWPIHVIPAGYYLYSFQDIPAGPSIFQSIFQHILEYMDTDSPLEGARSSKNRATLRKVAQNRSETVGKWTLAATWGLILCDSDMI